MESSISTSGAVVSEVALFSVSGTEPAIVSDSDEAFDSVFSIDSELIVESDSVAESVLTSASKSVLSDVSVVNSVFTMVSVSGKRGSVSMTISVDISVFITTSSLFD